MRFCLILVHGLAALQLLGLLQPTLKCSHLVYELLVTSDVYVTYVFEVGDELVEFLEHESKAGKTLSHTRRERQSGQKL